MMLLKSSGSTEATKYLEIQCDFQPCLIRPQLLARTSAADPTPKDHSLLVFTMDTKVLLLTG